MQSARASACAILGVILAAALWQSALAEDEPQVYVPELHPTYREEVPTRRRLARGADDPLTKAASKACGIELDFCIRLRRNMRREVMVSPESDPGPHDDFYTAGRSWLMNEYRLYGTVNKSERQGTSTAYRAAGHPIYVGLTASGGLGTEAPPPTVVTFTKDHQGKVKILDKSEQDFWFWTSCFVTDMTGDGLIDLAVVGVPGTSGGGGVTVFSIRPNGAITATGDIHSAYGMASLVDLNRDGIWEVETSEYMAYEGGSGSYQFSCLSKYDSSRGRWSLVTDRYPKSFRRQHRFYQAFLPALRNYERRSVKRTSADKFLYRGQPFRLTNISFESSDVARLLKSWDDYAADRY